MSLEFQGADRILKPCEVCGVNCPSQNNDETLQRYKKCSLCDAETDLVVGITLRVYFPDRLEVRFVPMHLDPLRAMRDVLGGEPSEIFEGLRDGLQGYWAYSREPLPANPLASERWGTRVVGVALEVRHEDIPLIWGDSPPPDSIPF